MLNIIFDFVEEKRAVRHLTVIDVLYIIEYDRIYHFNKILIIISLLNYNKLFKNGKTNILLGRNYTFDLIDTPYVLKIFGDKDKWGREIASLEFIKNKNIKAPQIYDCGLYNNNYWAIITRLYG